MSEQPGDASPLPDQPEGLQDTHTHSQAASPHSHPDTQREREHPSLDRQLLDVSLDVPELAEQLFPFSTLALVDLLYFDSTLLHFEAEIL